MGWMDAASFYLFLAITAIACICLCYVIDRVGYIYILFFSLRLEGNPYMQDDSPLPIVNSGLNGSVTVIYRPMYPASDGQKRPMSATCREDLRVKRIW